MARPPGVRIARGVHEGERGNGNGHLGVSTGVTAPESIDIEDHPGADHLDPTLREAIQASELSV